MSNACAGCFYYDCICQIRRSLVLGKAHSIILAVAMLFVVVLQAYIHNRDAGGKK